MEPRSPNVVRFEAGRISQRARFDALGVRGAVVWLTGLSASGKSTIGAALEDKLVRMGRSAFVLDGDDLRHGINGDLGFSHQDRVENVRRTSHVARLIAGSGAIAIVALISPYGADRAKARALIEGHGLDFLETYVATSLEECERRDPKGLYRRARAGEIRDFTGVSEPYEPPDRADVVLPTACSVEGAVDVLFAELVRRGLADARR